MAPGLASKVDLRSHQHYIASCLSIARNCLNGLDSLAEVQAREKELNLYPRLADLEDPREIIEHDEQQVSARARDQAREAVAQGRILFEHAAAGEGTRLMLGAKYLVNPGLDLTVAKIAHMMSQEAGTAITPKEVYSCLEQPPESLLPLALGTRHMLQLAFELEQLARELGEEPRALLARQHMLIIVGEEMYSHILRDFYQWRFFGFHPGHLYFMVQRSYHGLNLQNGQLFYDRHSPRRLHNHGQMVMQQTMDQEIFTVSQESHFQKNPLSSKAVGAWLQGFANKISYNIEDLDYLTGALDYPHLALVLELADQGYQMVMEVVGNNPVKPQKGGMAAWDLILGRNVMIESFQLGHIKNEEIRYLNRNFNHYPRPYEAWKQIKQNGLPMPVAVKEGYLYFQPVQGDINFLVPTAFVRRKALRPIQNLKSPATLPLAVNRLAAQDRQPGFKEFVARCRSPRP
ncbi:MAG: hypothetical protein ACLFUU_08220 [Desulfobacteraceae bacterium]